MGLLEPVVKVKVDSVVKGLTRTIVFDGLRHGIDEEFPLEGPKGGRVRTVCGLWRPGPGDVGELSWSCLECLAGPKADMDVATMAVSGWSKQQGHTSLAPVRGVDYTMSTGCVSRQPVAINTKKTRR